MVDMMPYNFNKDLDMPEVLDIYRDKSLRAAVDILRNHADKDELIKTAVDYSEAESLPDSAFAWPEKRRYPINGVKMAKLSCLYRTQYPPEMEGTKVPKHVDENFEKAAYFYNFEIPAKREKKIEKVASLKEEDCLIPSLKKFPVRDQQEGKFVQNLLIKNAHIMGYNHLAEACSNLITKMASYQASSDEINPVVYKYAGLTQSNKEVLLASIHRRRDFTDKETGERYCKLASIAEDMDFNRHNLIKIAHTLQEIDKASNMVRLYDKHIMNPMDSVFNTNKVYDVSRIKKASQDMFTDEMADMVTEEQIKNLLGEEVLTESMANDSLDKEKLVDVINSLPQDMIADFIERI